MKKFKVYGAEITKSRGLAYVYKFAECFEADDAETAVALFKERHKAPAGRRWSVKVNDVREYII